MSATPTVEPAAELGSAPSGLAELAPSPQCCEQCAWWQRLYPDRVQPSPWGRCNRAGVVRADGCGRQCRFFSRSRAELGALP